MSLQMSTAKSRCHPHCRASSDSLGCCTADALPPSDSQHSQRYCGLLQARKSPCMDSSSSCQMALGYLRRAAPTATHDDPAASRKLVSKSASGRHRAKSVSGKTMMRLMMLWRAPSKNASKTSGQDNRAKLERVRSTLQAALSLPRHTGGMAAVRAEALPALGKSSSPIPKLATQADPFCQSTLPSL